MLLNRENLKLHLPWVILFLAGSILAVILTIDFTKGGIRFPGGSTTSGYLLGVVAGLLIIFEILLWPRKKLFRRWRIGRVRTWMCAHIWLGLLTVPLAIVHAGFPWGGDLATITMVLLLIVVGSGILGLVLQQYIPRQMTNAAPGESIYSQIDVVAKQIVVEADALVSAATGSNSGNTDWSELYPKDKGGIHGVTDYVGASRSIASIYGKAFVVKIPEQPLQNTKILGAAYESQIRDFLELGRKSTSLLKDPIKQASFFEDLKKKVAPEAHFVIEQLNSWSNERRQLDIQVSLHQWLHTWLSVHLPLSIALLIVLIWHAIAASHYSGVISIFPSSS